jgi:hypothetical protein
MDRSNVIELWRGAKHTLDSTDDKGIIAALFDDCLLLLKGFLAASINTAPTQFDTKALESGIATLFFWGDEFGVSNGDLDKALQRSEDTRDVTLSVLVSLGEFLSEGKSLLRNVKHGYNIMQTCVTFFFPTRLSA